MDMELIRGPFGVYREAIKPREWEKMFADASSTGYQNHGISLGESDARLARLHWDGKQYKEIRRVTRNQSIRILSACFSEHRRFPLGSSSRELEGRGIRTTGEGTDFCQDLGVRMLRVVGYDAFYEPRGHEIAAWYRENILRCLEWAEQTGVMLATKSVEINLVKVNDTLRLIKEVDSPWLQICLNATNMKSLGTDPVAKPPQERGYIANVYVRDPLPDYFYGYLLYTFPSPRDIIL